MSYCRFRNTLLDLRDCYYNMNGLDDNREIQARKQLVELCKDIIDEYGEMEFNDDEGYCVECNGSGEGMYDGSTCMTCGGSGANEIEKEI
jgi:hypothetical protein